MNKGVGDQEMKIAIFREMYVRCGVKQHIFPHSGFEAIR